MSAVRQDLILFPAKFVSRQNKGIYYRINLLLEADMAENEIPQGANPQDANPQAQAEMQARAMAQAQMMKKIGRKMSILMGVTLSFFLSLQGNLLSGHFSVPAFLISFAVSTAISLIIGFLVPMKKVGDGVCNALHVKPRSIPARLAETLVSDVIYTPIITLAMVALAWKSATAHGAQIPFLPMFLHSLGLSMITGFVLIFIFMPLFMRLVIPKHE